MLDSIVDLFLSLTRFAAGIRISLSLQSLHQQLVQDPISVDESKDDTVAYECTDHH